MNNTYQILERCARKWVDKNSDLLPTEVLAFFTYKSQLAIEQRSYPEVE